MDISGSDNEHSGCIDAAVKSYNPDTFFMPVYQLQNAVINDHTNFEHMDFWWLQDNDCTDMIYTTLTYAFLRIVSNQPNMS